jgi:uridine phosphorylase
MTVKVNEERVIAERDITFARCASESQMLDRMSELMKEFRSALGVLSVEREAAVVTKLENLLGAEEAWALFRTEQARKKSITDGVASSLAYERQKIRSDVYEELAELFHERFMRGHSNVETRRLADFFSLRSLKALR